MIRIAAPKPAPDCLVAYSGRKLDGDLQFNQLRHYDPTVGRFISEEPAAYAGDADSEKGDGSLIMASEIPLIRQ
jgi:RHS repeat-associated protein